MIPITDQLKNEKVLISDGAWGTFLQQKGLAAGECPELWNLTRPDEVLDIARSYIRAGSDMIETNSFGANSFKLSAFGMAEKTREINLAAARISRMAAGTTHYVLGSIGPTGKIIMMDDVNFDQLYESFKEQAVALAQGGTDALVVETMSDLDEAKAAVQACRENTKCEVICTMTFQRSGENLFHTMMGVTPAQMTEEMTKLGADIIGANCGNGIEDMIGIVKAIRSIDRKIPVLIQPNAGIPLYRDGKTIFPETPEQMASYIEKLLAAGANIIGGCCGTTPEHIRMIVDRVRNSRGS